MWIKSQDKEILGKYTEVQVMDNEIIGLCHSRVTTLGVYKSNERAKKVLHNIQSFILNGNKEDIIVDNVRTVKEKVFFMPLK